MADKKTMHHMCVDVSGFRRACMRERGTWKHLLDKSTGLPFKSKERAIASLEELLAQGIRVMPLAECEGFDFQKGCPGHPVKDEVSDGDA